jgi:hypothetical protein
MCPVEHHDEVHATIVVPGQHGAAGQVLDDA